jgi:hypothetical protein
MAVLDVEVLCGGKPVFRYVQAWRTVPEYDEPSSVFVRKRPKQQAIYDAEDCGIRADSDGQREYCRHGERGCSGQSTKTVPHIL